MTAEILAGDCLAVLPTLAADSFDACVTDPPYHFGSIVKRFGRVNATVEDVEKNGALRKADHQGVSPYARAARGFMGKTWDGGDIAFQPETWAAVLRVLKPGAHMLAFGGTKGFHRMACAIEDAGFGIRDTIMWLYGSGFPKSHNQHGEWEGWGTALKPAYEPILLVRKPLVGTVAQNVLKYGTGAINIDGCRVAGAKPDTTRGAGGQNGRYAPIAAQGRILDDGKGRWPANIIHDGSDEVVEAFPDARGQGGSVSGGAPSSLINNVYGDRKRVASANPRNDSGSAARFFYCAKAAKSDRGADNTHPTVKPTELMRYLCRLVTPPGGTILDPFTGSGSTGKAAIAEGFNFTGIEREAEYIAIACKRLGLPAVSDVSSDNLNEGVFA